MLSCHYEKHLYSLSPQGVHCGFHVIVLPLHNLLSYHQLKYNVDNAKLREIFSLAGKVADVAKDKDGKSRGFGVVEMNHPVEAFSGNTFQLNTSFSVTQALYLFDNRTLYDRLMFVQMDRKAVRSDAAQSELSEVRRSIECRAKNTNGYFYNRVFVANVSFIQLSFQSSLFIRAQLELAC